MFGIWRFHHYRDNQSVALPVARDLLKAAEAHHDIAGRWIGHYCIGESCFQAGALGTATKHFQKALALDDLEQARSLPLHHGCRFGCTRSELLQQDPGGPRPAASGQITEK